MAKRVRKRGRKKKWRPKLTPFGVALGQEIRRRRKLLGWSQDQAASKAGMLKQQLQRYERGLRIPLADTACRIADALGVDVGELRPAGVSPAPQR